MKWAKELKQSPRALAEALAKALKERPTPLESVEVAGPGFLNLTLRPDFISDRLSAMLHSPRLLVPLPERVQRIIVEFSSPNVAKELHVGHLRSTIIGDVLRLNHIGDWGTQFGMLIAFLREEHPQIFAGTQKADLPQLMGWYRQSKEKFDKDPPFKKRAQLEVVALQRGDAASLQAWEVICAISRASYQEIYDLLDIQITERGESFYNPALKELIEDLQQKQLITVSDGAKCLFLEGFLNREGDPMPMILQKSDGGYNYDTTDMAAMRHRVFVEKADRIIILTDAGQSLHFQMLSKGAAAAGYLDPEKVRFDHVPFGVVLGPDGKKFKTRSGETEKLIDLLTTAVDRAKQILDERSLELTPTEIDQLAQILGIDAIKYADLAGVRTNDYVFSYEKMLRFEGNTAAFMLYAYVRIMGIKRRVAIDPATLTQTKIAVAHPSEISLGVHMLRFGEVLLNVANDLLPHRLADYLFELAEKFNVFFRDCRVEGSPEQNARLLLCELTARVLERGLQLLGLKTVDRM
jgi:arginyl-tRNA synthetase